MKTFNIIVQLSKIESGEKVRYEYTLEGESFQLIAEGIEKCRFIRIPRLKRDGVTLISIDLVEEIRIVEVSK